MAKNSDALRLFVALELPKVIQVELGHVQNCLRKINGLKASYPIAENLHLTLRFLGNIDKDKIDALCLSLQRTPFSQFEVSMGELGAFKDPHKNLRIIWIALKSEALFDLQRQIEKRLQDFVDPEKRPFQGHITLARVKSAKPMQTIEKSIHDLPVAPNTWKVDAFSLMKSTLTPKGAYHERIGYFLAQNHEPIG